MIDLFRPSGGLYYHGRALFNAGRWHPFHRQIETWLTSWPCRFDRPLLLVGPSAGYSLPSGWLRQFEQVTGFDLDPLTPPLFRWLHPRVRVEFFKLNLFWSGGRLSLTPLREILQSHPGSNILFCNVLGQVLLEGRAHEEEWLQYLRDLRETLNGHPWASYHDVYTDRRGVRTDHLLAGDWTEGLKVQEFTWRFSAVETHIVRGVFGPILNGAE